MQAFPPLIGGGSVQLRMRDCDLAPQVLSHAAQLLHCPKLPSTERTKRYFCSITSMCSIVEFFFSGGGGTS